MKTKNEKEKIVALKAKEYLFQKYLIKMIELKEVDTEKYGRLLAYVYIGKRCLNTELLAKHLAVSYDGGKRLFPTIGLNIGNQVHKII